MKPVSNDIRVNTVNQIQNGSVKSMFDLNARPGRESNA
jgi:hypothetical protein